VIKNILNTKVEIPRAAIFMSGSGSNAEKLLDSINNKERRTWDAAMIFTDAPLKSRAAQIAEVYKIPYFELDILDFYKKNGETKVSLATEKGRKIREEWTKEVRKIIRPFMVDFGILAGFVPLTNITSDFPCLNVHPGDLTIEENGQRIFVGLHTVPIEMSIIKNYSELRSSVIIAQTYTGRGREMDSGPILGISSPVKIDLGENKIEEIKKIFESRPPQRPPGGYKDLLENIAKINQEKLKINGDWIVFPPAVKDFASGKFGYDENNFLYYMIDGNWKRIRTVEYTPFQTNPIFI
jgi:folate-dependent phosphoribosylglycinamide formyltransferase PurN